jgi:membrane protease YdiL (CAAX protease family)
VGLRWYATVLVLPIVLVGVTVALIPRFGGIALDWTKRPDLAETAVMLVIFLLLPIGAPVSEEIGWRGFALPRLLAVRSALTATLILGVIWSVWHLPVVLDDPELRVPVPFMLAVIPTAVMFTWIFLHTAGSVLIAVLFHAWNNVLLAYFAEIIAPSDFERMWWLLFVVQSIAAIVIVLAQRQRFTQMTTDPAVIWPKPGYDARTATDLTSEDRIPPASSS